jgi:hypothetical protein
VVVMVSKKIGAFGASMAMKAGSALSFGATAYGMSTVFGGGARALRYGLQRYAPNSRTARVASRAAHFVENRKFDFRSIPGVAAGMHLADADEAAHPVGHSAVGGAGHVLHAVHHANEAANRQLDQDTRIPRLRAAITANNTAEIARHLGNMSDKELEENAHMIAHSPAAAAALTQARFDKLLTSENLSDTEKNNLRAQRGAGITARFTNTPHPDPRFGGRTVADVTLNGAPAGPGGVPPAIPGTSSAQRALLPGNVLAQGHVLMLLDLADFSAIARRGELAGADLTTTSAYLNASLAAGGPFAANIASMAATNRNFAAFFSLP